MESTKPSNHDVEKENREVEDDTTGFSTASDGPSVTARGPEELRDGTQETSNKFFCYICNITCHNQQACSSQHCLHDCHACQSQNYNCCKLM